MLRNRTLLAISVAVGAAYVGIGMVLPVRVLYAQSHGASLAIIGAMGSSFLLANFVCQYPTGWLADLWGRRRLILCGLGAQAMLSLLYLFVTDPILFVGLRVVEGAVAASVLPSARALIADIVPEDRRGEAYGVFSSFFNGGFLLGPALGGLFAAFGYSPAFIGSCVFRLLALTLFLTVVKMDTHATHEARARARSVPFRALLTPPLFGAYLLVFGDNIYFGFDQTLLPIWLRHNLGAPVTVIGLAYAVWALPNMALAPFGGRIADRVRRSRLIIIFGLAQVPMYAAYGLAGSVLPVLILFLLQGGVYALMQPAVDAHLAAASPPDARARAQGLYSAIGLAAGFLSASTLPVLYGVSFRLPLFLMAATFGLCVVAGGTLVALSERRGLLPGVRYAAAAVADG